MLFISSFFYLNNYVNIYVKIMSHSFLHRQILKIKAASSNERALTVHACRGMPRTCIQGKTLYMFEQFGVDGKLYVEVIMS